MTDTASRIARLIAEEIGARPQQVGAAVALLQRERLPKVDYADSEQIVADAGVVTVAGESVDWKAFTQQFVGSIAQHRHWERSGRAMVDA